MAIFLRERDARAYFKGCDVEQCEMCQRWTASQADNDEGEIIGPICTKIALKKAGEISKK